MITFAMSLHFDYENAYRKAQVYVHPTAMKADIILSGEANREDYKRFISEIIELIEEVHEMKSHTVSDMSRKLLLQ